MVQRVAMRQFRSSSSVIVGSDASVHLPVDRRETMIGGLLDQSCRFFSEPTEGEMWFCSISEKVPLDTLHCTRRSSIVAVCEARGWQIADDALET
jgi:hypothetical protein